MKIRASLAKKPEEVSAMFDDVAAKYDRVNSLFTFGCDKRWRNHMVSALEINPQMIVLDIATGTAVSARAISARGAEVVGVDFSAGMLNTASKVLAAGNGPGNAHITLLAADAMFLPFADSSFDAVSIAFGLRNVVSLEQSLAEILRVLKPGGRLVILETSVPQNRWFRFIVELVGYRFTRMIAKLASSHAQAYSYLIDSVLAWPNAQKLQLILLAAGYDQVDFRRLFGGVVAVHRAKKKINRTA